MGKNFIAALDQGTTSSRCIIFDHDQNIVSLAQREFPQIFPKNGWVEHNPMDIILSQQGVLMEALDKMNLNGGDLAGIGITNQRETTIVWDRETGLPVHNAIVWQCRRSAPLCEEILKNDEFTTYIRVSTGLRPDAYFSATKLRWLLDNVAGLREGAEAGRYIFGTVDTWLIWKLTGEHVTDQTNASRTMLYNIHRLEWDERILSELGIPKKMLPEVKSCSETYGEAVIGNYKVPVCGLAGDQQAALFGQACFNKGDVKNTYGTGNFILMNTGDDPVASKNGLLTTIGYSLRGKTVYALEGSVFVGGAALQWLRDGIRFIGSARDADYFGAQVPDSGGVVFVPAFTGLGAPYWDMYARGTMFGLTRGTTRNQIIRATLDAIAYQSNDVLEAMIADTGFEINEIRVDGGASVSDVIMQFQSNITARRLRRPMVRETTALGAAYLAGLACGFWRDEEELSSHWRLDTLYEPKLDDESRAILLKTWRRAVEAARYFTNK